MDLLTLLLFPVFPIILLIWFWYLLKPKCPECQKKVFKSAKVLDKTYSDTTPRKKDGSRDKRYNSSGRWEFLKEWTCKCGHSWQKWV